MCFELIAVKHNGRTFVVGQYETRNEAIDHMPKLKGRFSKFEVWEIDNIYNGELLDLGLDNDDRETEESEYVKNVELFQVG